MIGELSQDQEPVISVQDSDGLLPPREPKLLLKQQVLDYYSPRMKGKSPDEPNLKIEFTTFLQVHNSMLKEKNVLQFQFIFKGVASMAFWSRNTGKLIYEQNYLLRNRYDYVVKFANRPEVLEDPLEESKVEIEEKPILKEYRQVKNNFVINIHNPRLLPSFRYKSDTQDEKFGIKVSYSIRWKIFKSKDSFDYFPRGIRQYFYLRALQDNPQNTSLKLFKINCSRYNLEIPLETVSPSLGPAPNYFVQRSRISLAIPPRFPRGFFNRLESISIGMQGKLTWVYDNKNPFLTRQAYKADQNEFLCFDYQGNITMGSSKSLIPEFKIHVRGKEKHNIMQSIFYDPPYSFFEISFEFFAIGLKRNWFGKQTEKALGQFKTVVKLPNLELDSTDKDRFDERTEKGLCVIYDDPKKNIINVSYITDEDIESKRYWNEKGKENFKKRQKLWSHEVDNN